MAEDRAALLEEADRRGLLPPDMKAAYAEAKKRDLIKPEGMLARIGHGLMDPIYGAAQIGARMPEEGSEIGAAIMGQGDEWEAQRKSRQETVDRTIKEREAAIQAKRPADQRGSTDWLRVGGSLPSTMALSPPVLGGGVGGAIIGGAVSGAIGATLQPTTDTENFGTAKAESAAMGGAAGGVLGAGAKLAGAGVRAFGAYLAREYPENVMTQAVQKILKRMGQDEKAGGPTAAQALDLINESNAAGKPMTLADVGGENMRALGGNVARQPGESRNVATQFLNQRDQGAGRRLGQDIARYVHGGDSMHHTTQALVEARSAAGRPAWDAVRSMEGVWSPRLQQFIDDPALRAGMARGYEIERLESLAEQRPFNPTQMGVDLDEQGNIRIVAAPNMRVLHMGKMGLDAMIADERNEITGRLSQRGVALDRVRRAYLQEIDGLDQQGIYRNARALWEGPSSSMDAIRAGRGLFTSSPEEIGAEFEAMSPANQEFYRVGVADALRERLMKTGFSGDDAKAIIKNPWMREQLRPIFRTEADFNGFVEAVTREGAMFGTRFETLGGPQTAKRLAEDASNENAMAAHGMHLAEQVGTAKWFSAIKTATRMWRDRQDRAGNPKLNEQIARILFQTPIEPGSEVGQRLTGQFAGPQSINRLAPAADTIGQAARALAPGAGSALAQPTQ
jgi:hypothetical protein